MADPPSLVVIGGLIKGYAGPEPLRVADLTVAATDRVILGGLDRDASEMFIHLVTGAALPDEGHVRIAGRDTRDIATDVEWLQSLDRFGIVTDRAVLIDKLPVAANLALPLTLSIDPMAPEIRARVEELARDVELAPARLDRPVADLSALERVRLHLARALASRPELILLEEPTRPLSDPADSAALGVTLRKISARLGVGWIGLTNDAAFAKASRGRRRRLDRTSGRVSDAGLLWRFWRT